jgi:hypothetical protein
MSAGYRTLARQALERARALFAGNDRRPNARWAALELRDALEFMTYDRMLQYKDEVSPKEYESWPAANVLELLREIDPAGDVTASIFFRHDPTDQSANEKDKPAGRADRLTHADLNDHYEALSRYLHVLTVEQIEAGQTRDESELKAKCEACIGWIDRALSSSIPDSEPAVFASFVCARCKNTVMRRMPPEHTEPITATCISCGARYTATPQESGQFEWTGDTLSIACGTAGCTYGVELWREQVRPGVRWVCTGCNSHWVIHLALGKVEPRETAEGPIGDEKASRGDSDAEV